MEALARFHALCLRKGPGVHSKLGKAQVELAKSAGSASSASARALHRAQQAGKGSGCRGRRQALGRISVAADVAAVRSGKAQEFKGSD